MFPRATRTTFAKVAALAVATSTATLLPATSPADASRTSQLKVGTYNIIASTSPDTFGNGVRAVAGRVDVLGLQEVNSRDKESKMNLDGWNHYRSKAASQTPIMWRSSRFGVISKRSVKLTGKRFIGNEMPSKGKNMPAKYASVVRLKDRSSGRKMSFVNVHLVSGAVKGGVGRSGRPRLFDLYKDQIRATTNLARHEAAHFKVFTMGDFNISWRPDEKIRKRPLVFASFHRKNMPSMWATERPADYGTRGTGLLDQVYSKSKAVDAAVATDIGYSDHKPAIATYSVAHR